MSLAFAGCDGSSDPEGQSDESPAVAAGAAPEVGTCWAVDAEDAVDQQYWYDDSAQVPCTEPHTTETAITVPVEDFTAATLKRVAEGCVGRVLRYVGIDEDNWVPWGYFVYGPSKEEVDDGAAWVRCDAVFPETWAEEWEGARSVTGSASGLAADPPEDFWACLDQPPATNGQPFVPCDQPHNYEQTGTLAFLTGLDRYPAAVERAMEGRRQCRSGVPAGYEGVSVTAEWDPPEVLKGTTDLSGVCFMFNADGQPLPAR
jgi:hypothetical protein